MTKYYLTLKPLANVPNAYHLDSETFLGLTGYNVGNLVFRKGLAAMVDGLDSFTRITFADLKNDPSIYSDAEIVVVSCANWLGMRPQNETSNQMRAERIEKFKCSVVAFGLGIQAGEEQEIRLGPNTLALAKTLASKSSLLSVRDRATASFLQANGIKNVVNTGCPSNFINLKLSPASFSSILSQDFSSMKWDDISSLISEATMGHALSGDFLTKAFDILERSASKYALQTGALLSFLRRETDELSPPYRSNTLRKAAQIQYLVRDKAVCFSGVDEWMFAARTFQLCFGMRMHGTMVGLQAGVPSVMIAHDRRTIELAKTMAIPRMNLAQFIANADSGPQFLFARFQECLPEYFRRRRRLASRFANIIKNSGLRISGAFGDYMQEESAGSS